MWLFHLFHLKSIRIAFGVMDIGGRCPNIIRENGHRRDVLVLQHIANFLCHAIKSDTIRTGDMPFVRIILPRAENQNQT